MFTFIKSCFIGMLIIAINIPVYGSDNKTTRRSFFKRLKDNYIAGRLEAATNKEERRIIERRENEKLRRRAVYERNVKTLVDGIAKRLRQRTGQIKIIVVGGIILVVWLCHKGSIGCDNDRNKDN